MQLKTPLQGCMQQRFLFPSAEQLTVLFESLILHAKVASAKITQNIFF